jgi:hypothetical protein
MQVDVDTGEVFVPVRVRPRVQVFFNEPSLTRQEFKDECDLGLILKRFALTPEGVSALKNAHGFAEGCKFEDVSAVGDYHTAQGLYIAAMAKFDALPAIVRQRFNTPAEFFDFASNPANVDEMRKFGLAKPVEPVGVPKA